MRTFTIGIDIGGTNTDIGLVDDKGQVLERANLPTKQYLDERKYVSDIADKIGKLMANNGVEAIDGIGIGAPNADYYSGKMGKTVNLNFENEVDFKTLLRKYFDVPVVVSNDANAAAYGELVYGGAKNCKHFILFTLGTGVGSGIVIDGKLVHGFTGAAGELGHAILIPEGRQCSCGLKGCLETYCSATGICRTTVEMLDNTPNYNGMLLKVKRSEITSKMVSEAAAAGDKLAMEVFEKTGYWLGIALANAVSFSSPEKIFVMGGPVKAGDLLLRPLRKSFDEHLLFVFKDKVELCVSGLPDNDAAILGAAALAKA